MLDNPYFYIFLTALASAGAVLIYFWFQVRREIIEISKLLQGTAWEIVRFMENNPRSTPGKNRKSLNEQFREYVTEPAKELHKVPERYKGELRDSAALVGAIEQVKAGNNESNAFWHKTQGMRNGIQCFIEIMVLGNPKSAYFRMIDHMKRQRDEFENKGSKGSPNFTQLKLSLGLPTEWPTEDLPEVWAEKGIDPSREDNIVMAAKRYRYLILNRLTYREWPPPGSESQERTPYTGEELLVQMRDYIR